MIFFFVLVVLQLQHIDCENFDLVPTRSVSRCTRASALCPWPAAPSLITQLINGRVYIHRESKHRMLTTAGAESVARRSFN